MNTYRIGEAAKATGLSPHTIRFYEGRGLLQPVPRSESGYRRYDEGDLRRLCRIQNARTLGIPLDEIQELLEDIHRSTCGAYAGRVLALVDRQRQEIDQRITELQRIRAELDTLAADATAASGSSQLVADCPCCLLMDDGSGGAGYCSPSTSSIADRLTEDMLEVLQCDIGARPDAPTPDDLAPNLQSASIEGDQLVLRFERSAIEAVRQFAAAECVCCGGMGWEVSETADVVVLTVSGSRAQVEVMATAWPVPEAAL
jgi:MerR family copper efflux transcriptional regulator